MEGGKEGRALWRFDLTHERLFDSVLSTSPSCNRLPPVQIFGLDRAGPGWAGLIFGLGWPGLGTGWLRDSDPVGRIPLNRFGCVRVHPSRR